MNEIHCQGCGVLIQTEDKLARGYAPASALTREEVICQRCFRLRHYNEIQDIPLDDDEFLQILHGISETDSIVVKIVDIFDFQGSWLNGLQRFVGNKDIILVGNKVDLLPKSVNQNKIINWMRMSARELGLKPSAVFLISAAKGHGISELALEIDKRRAGKDVYVVGCTNVGKSTFINRLIKSVTGTKDDVITTSLFPGTTLDLIGIPLDDGALLYDTPGIINPHQMAHVVSKKTLKVIQPTKEIKPKVFQLNEKQTLFIGGLGRFDYIRGGRRSFTCYFSNALQIHRTKLEKADQLYKEHLGNLLQPPFAKEEAENMPTFEKHEFYIKEDKTDIVFSGLGWITVNQKDAHIAVHSPKGVGVSIRKSVI